MLTQNKHISLTKLSSQLCNGGFQIQSQHLELLPKTCHLRFAHFSSFFRRCRNSLPSVCCTSLNHFVLVSRYHFFRNGCEFVLKWILFFCSLNLGSTNASEEAVQNPHQNHSQRAIPGANIGSQKWRFPCDQSYKQCTIQRYHALVKITKYLLVLKWTEFHEIHDFKHEKNWHTQPRIRNSLSSNSSIYVLLLLDSKTIEFWKQ